jgi:S1-C subfamily serine protease
MTNGQPRADSRPRKIGIVLAVAALLLAASIPSAPPAAANALAGSPASASRPIFNDAPRASLDLPDSARTALWPFFNSRRPPIYESQPHNVTPHPAVARISVPESGATAFGSGTPVDVREEYGLVVTNWHVVRDACGPVDVSFPSGFRSQARPLKVDSNWDLAALVVWRPPIEPVKLAQQPPQPGDMLTIHGYGRGQYRIATGRCTSYYAPKMNFPMEMVELDVEARQGDSGGPIFNQRGELAGVLFGAGQGTTLGSYAPRVSNFLATLAPDIGQAKDQAEVAVADRPAPNVEKGAGDLFSHPSTPWSPPKAGSEDVAETAPRPPMQLASNPTDRATSQNESPSDFQTTNWYEALKSMLAVVGLAAIALKLVKVIG